MADAQKSRERIIAIVGRPNVGKSALFNRLAGRRIAIVHDMPGVTRDRLSAPMKDAAFPLTLMDTGGIGANLDDGFADMVRTEAEIALTAADLILFVVDALEGINQIDLSVAHLLRKQGKPVVLGINKADDPKHDEKKREFGVMGFKNVCTFSSTHGRGIDALIAMLETVMGPPTEPVDTSAPDYDPAGDPRLVRVAIVGRPNVGKSSIYNAILRDDRAIVSDVAGTTRDAIDSYYNHRGNPFLLIDTAGIRRSAKVDTAVESFMVARAETSIRRSDLAALVIDAERGVTAQERKIAGTILEENKPCIIIANKFDLYQPDKPMAVRMKDLEEHVRRELFFLHYAPLVVVSALNRDRMGKIFTGIEKVREASESQLGTGAFNRLLQDAIARTPPPHLNGKRFKLFYATLAREEMARPILAPRVVLFVNHGFLMSPTYRRYLENTVREKMIYEGLPIRFDVREREQKGRSERGKILEAEPVNMEEGVEPRPKPMKERNPGSHRPMRKATAPRARPKRKAPGKGKTKKGKKIIRGRNS